MRLHPLSALRVLESVQVVICLLCLIINARTLRDAIVMRRVVLASGKNHGAGIFTLAAVRSRWCLLFVQIVSVALATDRLLHLVQLPPEAIRFEIFGFLRTAMSVLVAATGLVNMRSFSGWK